MTQKARRRIAAEAAVWGTFGLGLTLLGSVTISTYVSTSGISRALESGARTREIASTSALFLSEFRESQSERRAFLLTGDQYFVDQYHKTFSMARGALASLESLTRGDSAQRTRVRAVSALMTSADSLGQITIALRQTRGLEAAAALVRSRIGHLLVSRVEEAVREIEMVEQVRFSRSLADARGRARAAQRIAIIASVLAILLVSGAALIIRNDVRERRERSRLLKVATEAAQAATVAKGDFLASMSHEIRTPLNGIIGMTDLALDTELTARQREYLRTARSSAESLLRVLNDILDFSKIEAGRLDLHVAPFALRDLLSDTLRPLGLRAKQKGLELAYHVGRAVPDRWVGDSGRLQQIIINLVGNAIKFTERGEVVVQVAGGPQDAAGSELHISVRDTGIGIPKERQRAVFEQFSQADSSTTRRFGGTGLGLTISERLVQLMGGRIWLESAVGLGSTFHFTTRLAAGETTAVLHAEAGVLDGMPVLLVEDHQASRVMLEEMVSSWRLRPTAVSNGAEALLRAEEAERAGSPFKVAVVDSVLPDAEGYALAKRLVAVGDIPERAVIILSSDNRPAVQGAATDLHLGRSLMKPVKGSELLDAILSAVGPSAPGRTERVAPHAARGWPGTHVLVVEDNDVNQRVARGMLERRGVTVSIASNGREAVERFTASPDSCCDMIFMDIEMPEMDGLSATERIREWEGSHLAGGLRTPIVALTAHALPEHHARCAAAGMDMCLTKPLRAPELDAALQRFLGEPRALEERDAHPAPSAVGPSDVERMRALLTMVDDDRDLLRIVAAEYRRQTPKLVTELRAAVNRRDLAEISRLAHRIKGSSLQVAGESVGVLAGRLENNARDGTLQDAERLMSDIEREATLLAGFLERVTS